MESGPPSPTGTFSELGISPKILEELTKRSFVTPTPIQHQAIPPALKGNDVIGIAQTGTGKTLAFGIPMLEQLSKGPGRGLIVVPTRELAFQVEESLNRLAPVLGIGTAVFVGGAPMGKQIQAIRRNPRILIATPGRLNDHLQQRTVTLKEVNILVLDEADRMLDMGFKPQIEQILKQTPTDRQTMLFSATMAKEILTLANQHMKSPLRIEVAPAGTAAEKVEQEFFVVKKEDKSRLLELLLEEHPGTVLVFSRTKHGARKITKNLRNLGHTAAEIHADRSLAQRTEALNGFKSGKYRVLVATDIAARGIHVSGIGVVINYDLPNDSADYVHRIGRTARAGREGRAISFAMPDQMKNVKDIEKLIRKPLPRKNLPTLPPARHNPEPIKLQNGTQVLHHGSKPGALPTYQPRPQQDGERPPHRGGRRPSGGSRNFRGGRKGGRR